MEEGSRRIDDTLRSDDATFSLNLAGGNWQKLFPNPRIENYKFRGPSPVSALVALTHFKMAPAWFEQMAFSRRARHFTNSQKRQMNPPGEDLGMVKDSNPINSIF